MKLKQIIILLMMGFTIALSHSVFAQSNTNYADVRVDELTDAQIREMMRRAESIGYSDAQLEQLAAAQGMNGTEIQKLRLRVQKIRNEEKAQPNTQKGTTSPQNPSRNYNPDNLRADSLNNRGQNSVQSAEEQRRQEISGILEGLKPKIFGEELFRNTSLTFEPNLRLATPRGYVVGPDDELLIDLSGDNEANYQLKVSPEGFIVMEYVGRIAVGGLTIDQATSKIRNIMSGTYPGLRNGRTNIAVNLGNIRSIRITVLGEVKKPGSYTVPSLATAFNVLHLSGGPNQNGSFRKIQIIRNNRVLNTIDVYDLLLSGIQKGNIRLQDQDVINVPVYESRVELAGEVKRPALYEVLATENLSDVLRFGGGFSPRAYTANVKILQNTSRERRILDVNVDSFAVYRPRNGDRVLVESILERFENRVEISGAVFRPGQYELDPGLTLKGLIERASGVTEDAFLNRGYITRLNTDNTLALLSFDVSKVMDGTEEDVVLKREDKVMISSIFNLREEYEVSIQGEVRAPGAFKYAENMTLEALIQMAGGFREGATPNRIEISRRIKNSDAMSLSARTAEVFTVNVDQELKLQDTGFVLRPYDIVSIRSSEGYQVQRQITLEGEVLFPGTYTITRKDERISDVIKRAGGLTPLAYSEGASLKRGDIEESDALTPEQRKERAEEERLKILNLRRLKQQGAADTTAIEEDLQITRSNLVGIRLDQILRNPLSRNDLILEDGDVIRIPKELQTVRVTGEVLKPNSIVYNRNKSFKGYVDGAGGFSYNAYRKGAYVVYPNGSIAAAKRFLFFNNYPQIKPGSEIFVPKRAEREKLNAQTLIGISTAIASLAAIVLSLIR